MELSEGKYLPGGFTYPGEFKRIVKQGLLDLDPWAIIVEQDIEEHYEGMKSRYPARKVVPFARRRDNDDVACFDLDKDKVVIIHDFASPGWEQRKTFDSFWHWFRHAVEDMIEYDGD